MNIIRMFQDSSPSSYYAIFDGHAGQDAASYSAAHLHQFLVESAYYPTDPERALKEAFLRTDEFFLEKSKIEVSFTYNNKIFYYVYYLTSDRFRLKSNYVIYIHICLKISNQLMYNCSRISAAGLQPFVHCLDQRKKCYMQLGLVIPRRYLSTEGKYYKL